MSLRLDPEPHELADLGSDLEGQHQSVGEHLGQRHCESAVAAADVENAHRAVQAAVAGEGGVVPRPVHGLGSHRVAEAVIVRERVAVGPAPEELVPGQ